MGCRVGRWAVRSVAGETCIRRRFLEQQLTYLQGVYDRNSDPNNRVQVSERRRAQEKMNQYERELGSMPAPTQEQLTQEQTNRENLNKAIDTGTFGVAPGTQEHIQNQINEFECWGPGDPITTDWVPGPGVQAGPGPQNQSGGWTPSEEQNLITQWGWVHQGGNQWSHPEVGQGYWSGNKFIAPGAVDPSTGQKTGATFDLDAWNTNRQGAVYNVSQEDRSAAPGTATGNFGHAPTHQGMALQDRQNVISNWGWVEQPDGTWKHDGLGITGYWSSDNVFVSPDAIDPQTGQKTGATFDLHNWEREGLGAVYRVSDDQLPGDPSLRPTDEGGEYEPIQEGEFLAPPPKRPAFDPAASGFMPFNRSFSYDPEQHGFDPFNQEFEFDPSDLEADPGYQFRLKQGEKSIQRSNAAKGLLQSGKTLKDLSSFSQGLASQEYGDAYNRAVGRFGMRQGQSRDARDRALQNWGMRYGTTTDAYGRNRQNWQDDMDWFQTNRSNRFNSLLALSNL